jgi:hypothetical protein
MPPSAIVALNGSWVPKQEGSGPAADAVSTNSTAGGLTTRVVQTLAPRGAPCRCEMPRRQHELLEARTDRAGGLSADPKKKQHRRGDDGDRLGDRSEHDDHNGRGYEHQSKRPGPPAAAESDSGGFPRIGRSEANTCRCATRDRAILVVTRTMRARGGVGMVIVGG